MRSSRRVAASRVAVLAAELLDASTLCAIATVIPGGRAHVNTAYFAWTPRLEIVWMSDPAARHSRNLRRNDSAAIAVFDSAQTWGGADRGIQLFGTAREAPAEDLERCRATYDARFEPAPAFDLTAYRLYRFRPRRVKLFDEPSLGGGVFVTATVGGRGQLAWDRTEVYRAGTDERR